MSDEAGNHQDCNGDATGAQAANMSLNLLARKAFKFGYGLAVRQGQDAIAMTVVCCCNSTGDDFHLLCGLAHGGLGNSACTVMVAFLNSIGRDDLQ